MLTREKKNFSLLAVAILFLGMTEVVGIASILPFMELIANPDAINESRMLKSIFEGMNFASQKEMLIYFGSLILLLLVITNVLAVFTIWLQYKYTWNITHRMSVQLLSNYLRKPYQYFLNNNSSDIKTYILGEVLSLTNGLILPLIEIVSRAFVAIVIFLLLLYVDVQISLIMFFGLGGVYLLIYLSRKNFLKRIGEFRIKYNISRFKSLDEMLSGIKTILVYQKVDFFFRRFEKSSKNFTEIHPKYNLVLAAPKYIIELLAFGGILAISIYLFVTSGNLQGMVPRLSLFAVSGYRLLPALQKIFAAGSKLRHNWPVLDKMYDDLIQIKNQKTQEPNAQKLIPFEESIKLSNLSYAYNNAQKNVIDQLNVEISKGSKVAFVGSTGSGKTTLVDLIVGLLTTTNGVIEVDDIKLDEERIAHWQSQIAYVPQEVFLFDDSVKSNITMVDDQEINQEQLIKAAQMAEIHDFIVEKLLHGYDTEIGERGVRLSGGQRQRLGLARALYANPELLILDEATSALDRVTENDVMVSIQSLPSDLTTIIIAHRLSTVKHADCIYVLNEGKIVAFGNYDELIQSNDIFQSMVQLS